MKKKIILISGDPNSINSEIIFKCWNLLSNKVKKSIFLISNYELIKKQFKILNYKINTVLVKDLDDKNFSSSLKIINVKLNFKNPFSVSQQASSKYILQSLSLAHKLALKNNVAGIINCPINKNLLNKKNIGVTEFLASKCNIKKNKVVMLIKNKNLMVSPMTTHLDVRSISKNLNKNMLIDKVKIIDNWYKKLFKKRPKFAMLGLNPHNSELKSGSEEKKIIIPAINKLIQLGVLIRGPFVSDTMFINDYKKYNIIIGMYHDQVLTPFKTLYKFDAINLTLGLKYVRVSPDHGVAFDKILLKKSNPESLFKCIQYINKLIK